MNIVMAERAYGASGKPLRASDHPALVLHVVGYFGPEHGRCGRHLRNPRPWDGRELPACGGVCGRLLEGLLSTSAVSRNGQ